MRRIPLILMFASLIETLAPAVADAHAIGVDCTLRGDRVEVEAYYDDDTAATKAKVQVFNDEGELIAQGSTDGQGQWHFPTPAPGKYEVRVDAGAGHRTKKTFHVPVQSIEPAPAESEGITEGPNRLAFTRIRWLKALIGLSVLGGLSGAYWLATLRKKNGLRNRD